jgi:hypothetical protein
MKLGLGFLHPERSPLTLSPEICGCVEPLMKQLTETRRQQMSGSGKGDKRRQEKTGIVMGISFTVCPPFMLKTCHL